MIRYGEGYADRADHSGVRIEQATGGAIPAHTQYSKVATAGIRWDVSSQFMVRAEYQRHNGTLISNRKTHLPAATVPDWDMFACLFLPVLAPAMSKTTPGQDAAGAKFLEPDVEGSGAVVPGARFGEPSVSPPRLQQGAAQFEAEQSEKRLAQTREFSGRFLSNGSESMSTFASFIPLCRCRPGWGADALHERVAAALSEHGLMLDVEWGIEAVHYFVGDSLIRRLFHGRQAGRRFRRRSCCS